ncbi:hypothetical protein SCLCIDRAFT_869553 [Scleroderma citrinum Foug A]|uniref:Uncharacterized protein n=1 Tax=Scleroderma citrinum Foug A TaxID=1036808 RepID=A0A0C2ZJ49_9AGAM|nr:hypothetical protein SCLCIDRAFT_869553 [Scleroderma citrinum Foug A]
MALTRAVIPLCARNFNSGVSLQQRVASHSNRAHEDLDGTQTHAESGFFTPFWRNTLFLSLAAVGFYKWAPKSDEKAYLTKWLSHYSTPREVWTAINEQQLLRSQEVAVNNVLQTSAQRPSMVRYRYPQALEQSSPHLQPIGAATHVSYNEKHAE